MPAKGSVKYYLPNSIYHIYNRGVEKRKIFLDEQDHKVFLSYLKQYLSDPNDASTPQSPSTKYHKTKSYFDEIQLLAFCLMPNHLHLLIKQKDKNSIKNFTQSLFTRYSMYFNKKYNRSGSLFQGRYKATNVINKDYLLDVSRYIHKNPLKYSKDLINVYSSYAMYLGFNNTTWINKHIVLDYFNESTFIKHNNINSYKYFVEKFKYASESIDLSSDPIVDSIAGSDPAISSFKKILVYGKTIGNKIDIKNEDKVFDILTKYRNKR